MLVSVTRPAKPGKLHPKLNSRRPNVKDQLNGSSGNIDFSRAIRSNRVSAMNMFAYLFFSYATSHIESETECHCSQSYWLDHRALVFSSSFFLAPASVRCTQWPVGRQRRCKKKITRVKDYSRFARRVRAYCKAIKAKSKDSVGCVKIHRCLEIMKAI